MSSKVRFLLFVTLFWCGVPGAISCDTIPHAIKNSVNFVSKYSPPQSGRIILISLPNRFSTYALNFLNLPKVSDFLCISKHTHILNNRQ